MLAAQFGLQPLLAKRLLPRGAAASVILLSSNTTKILISAAVLLHLGSEIQVSLKTRSTCHLWVAWMSRRLELEAWLQQSATHGDCQELDL